MDKDLFCIPGWLASTWTLASCHILFCWLLPEKATATNWILVISTNIVSETGGIVQDFNFLTSIQIRFMITEIWKKTVSRNILHFYSKATLSNLGTCLHTARMPKDAGRLCFHKCLSTGVTPGVWSLVLSGGYPWSLVLSPWGGVPQSGL